MLLQRYPPLCYHISGNTRPAARVEECGRVLPNGVQELFEGGTCEEEVAEAATLFDECKSRPLNIDADISQSVGSKGLATCRLEDRVFCTSLDTNHVADKLRFGEHEV